MKLTASQLPSTSVTPSSAQPPIPIGHWHRPLEIVPSRFKHKSLCDWAINPAIGCLHGCEFCYVPSVSANKLAPRLLSHGVTDPDREWGDYLLLRPWKEKVFLTSLRRADRTPQSELSRDGNRAILFSSTTDPFQVVRHQDPAVARQLNDHFRHLIRRSLELIRDHSSLNVRILTRSPLAKREFSLLASLGNRLVFGMSLPTLDSRLARIYEPHAPSPAQRLRTLQAAREAGLSVYVAIAPTYPECDESDLRRTLEAVRDIDPITIFHEPINIRAENVARIRTRAESLGVSLRTDVFETRTDWANYALSSLQCVERVAKQVGVGDRFHLWPDPALGSLAVVRSQPDPAAYQAWLERCWSRISEWPR